jgi:hypothetical protein
MPEVKWNGNNALVITESVVCSYESVMSPRDLDTKRIEKETLGWTGSYYHLDGYTVYPYGSSNDLPKIIHDVVTNNNIAPGMLTKQTQLLWGKGLKLYTEDYENGVLIRNWDKHPEIQSWLDSWDADDYIMRCAIDYHPMSTAVTKVRLDRGGRIGRVPKIASLEHMNMNRTRKAKVSSVLGSKATHCVYTMDLIESRHYGSDYAVYPLFDFKKPLASKTSVFFSNMYSFLSDYYTVPDIYGSLEWLRRSTAIPLILEALSFNGLAAKYHVTSPHKFWIDAESRLKRIAEDANKIYKDQDLINYKTEYLRKVTSVLSGESNTGKLWHTVDYIEVDGHNIKEQGWKIKEIKQNTKEFIQSQLLVSDESRRGLTAGLGIHQALGAAGEKGKTDSGGEQMNAIKNYLATGIDIPEMVVCKALNYAIKTNFPGTSVRAGFYHVEPQREQDISPSKRFKEKIG